jgi:hypothetical protein
MSAIIATRAPAPIAFSRNGSPTVVEIEAPVLEGIESASKQRAGCEALEHGQILLLRDCYFFAPWTGWDSLREIRASALRQKNIAFDARLHEIRGIAGSTEHRAIRAAMQAYCAAATRLCAMLLRPYAADWRVDLTSFRPAEERSRDLPRRERNDVLHIDSFPSRPTNGARILRCFTNIHPSRPRVWLSSDPLEGLPASLFDGAGISQTGVDGRIRIRWYEAAVASIATRCGIYAARRSPYDRLMLHLHDYMKSSRAGELNAYRHEFPPGATWIVFTDAVPHAVLEGQFALEQTFIVPRHALVEPERAPLAFLERLTGMPLTNNTRALSAGAS